MELKEVERKRKLYRNSFLFGLFFWFVAWFILALFVPGDGGVVVVVVGILAFPAWYSFLTYQVWSRWTKLFKFGVLDGLLRKNFNNFNFNPFACHSFSTFVKSRLFDDYTKPNVYNGENYLEGDYRGIKFSVSWIGAGYEEVREDSEGNRYTVYYKIFQGIFIEAESFKEIEGYVLLYPPKKKKRLKLDHPEFDKYFSVYASSEFEAYYILDHAFMERLMRLKDSIGRSIRLSFQGKTLYIAIEDMNFLPTPSLFRSLEKVDLESYVREVKKVLEFLEYLKLNQRLGTSL